ncbi:unnamed protein product [Sphagnum balticum]
MAITKLLKLWLCKVYCLFKKQAICKEPVCRIMVVLLANCPTLKIVSYMLCS